MRFEIKMVKLIPIMSTSAEFPLPVIEYGGNARSGKGTIVKHLQETLPQELGEIAPTDTPTTVHLAEAGADYRAITAHLLEREIITDNDTSKSLVDERLAQAGFGTEAAARVLAEDKKAEFEGTELDLYGTRVTEAVPLLGENEDIRQAVKGKLSERLASLARLGLEDVERPGVVLLDGRALAAVVRKVPGVVLALSNFVECNMDEAAKRECLRRGIILESEEAKRIRIAIENRNRKDATRAIDPVRVNEDAMSYEAPEDDTLESALELGIQAATEDRQVVMDTTELSLERMKNSAYEIARGALLTHFASTRNVAIS